MHRETNETERFNVIVRPFTAESSNNFKFNRKFFISPKSGSAVNYKRATN